jgi:hypothetical protein
MLTVIRTSVASVLLALAAVPAVAQNEPTTPPTPPPATPPATTTTTQAAAATERLFLAFAEEPLLADRQWWEAQLDWADSVADRFDAWVLRGVVAFQPWDNVELGGRAGFGGTDVGGAPIDDGSGATDLDVWGKYAFGGNEETDFAAGALVTVPTGDDAVGLGNDAFGLALFGSARYRLPRFAIGAHLGARFNEDGQIFGVAREGETSLFFGGAVTWPLSDEITAVGEVRYEGERFTGGDEDTRVLGGLNWRVFNTGMLRGAVAAGLSDGSPDIQFIGAYAAQF